MDELTKSLKNGHSHGGTMDRDANAHDYMDPLKGKGRPKYGNQFREYGKMSPITETEWAADGEPFPLPFCVFSLTKGGLASYNFIIYK